MKSYASPAAFKVALNARLRDQARRGALPVDRVRTVAVMERFLARLLAVAPATTMLKGGLALELRLERARSTRDIDLRILGEPSGAAALVESAARILLDPHDFLDFRVAADPHQSVIHGDGAVYDGFRFIVTPTLAGERYGDVFGVDISFGDVIVGEVVELVGGQSFAFIGVQPVAVRAYPIGSHIAEKLHAYTLPRQPGVENSRLKDLPDLALLAANTVFDGAALRAALDATFDFRGTHPLPSSLPAPPASWADRYLRMAAEEALPWQDLATLFSSVQRFLDPVLAGRGGTWDLTRWRWVEPPT